jgi:ankyrin repeat protein
MNYTNNNSKMIYENFENICINCNEQEIEQYIKLYNIDVNYDDGYYLEIICKRNNLNLLKLMIKYGANININNEGITRLVAHKGYIELLDYLLNNYNINYDKLYSTTACSNNKMTVDFLNNYKIIKC